MLFGINIFLFIIPFKKFQLKLPTSFSTLPSPRFQLPTSNFLLLTDDCRLPTTYYFPLPSPHFQLPTLQ
jgi:hypothetical protein